MRVAYLCADPGIPVLGSKGASVHVQQIVRAFQRRGDTVTVYCTRRGDADPAVLGDARIVEHRVARGDVGARERAVARASERLAELARRDDCDLVYERYSLFSAAATRVGVPSVVEVNAPLVDEQRRYRGLVDARGATAVTRALLSRASAVACVSRAVADWAGAHGAEHPVVAPNGVDTRSFTPARIDDGVLRTVFVGSLKPWHGVDAAIDALAGLDGVTLTVVGDGPERGALERRAAEKDVALRWLGAVPHADVPGVLSEMHVGLAPYPPDTGDYFSPLKAYEYLAAGLAVIGSDCGQLTTLLRATGVLVPPGDATALRDALCALRDHRERARELGGAARAQAVARHDWDRTLETILAALPVGAIPRSAEMNGVPSG